MKYDIVRKGGSLTLTSGTAGIKPGKDAAIGGALNGGVLSLTSGLATDLAEKKIRVNTVVPGLVKTPLWDKQGKTPEEQVEIFKSFGDKLPVGFVAGPEHIAEAYLYAIRADYTTGKLIEIGEWNVFGLLLMC
jgi:NAD(P)-dependent dehydrogenase (short-subunit alcohol dehydrogenase family)